MFFYSYAPHIKGCDRSRPTGHARGRARGHAGISGSGLEAASSSSTPDDVFSGVHRGAQLFCEMDEGIRKFIHVA